MVRQMTIPLLLLVVGMTTASAQIAPGPAASPYTPSSPAFAPGPAAPGPSISSPIAPGPAEPQSSFNNPPAAVETFSDRVVRCTHYGTSVGVQPNDIGPYSAQCAQSD